MVDVPISEEQIEIRMGHPAQVRVGFPITVNRFDWHLSVYSDRQPRHWAKAEAILEIRQPALLVRVLDIVVDERIQAEPLDGLAVASGFQPITHAGTQDSRGIDRIDGGKLRKIECGNLRALNETIELQRIFGF